MMKKTYPFDIKKQVVELYFAGHSPTDLVNRFNISERTLIYKWVNKVKTEGWQGLERKKSTHPEASAETRSKDDIIENLKLQNDYLKKLISLKRG